jgi:hypothetical protein
MVVAARHIAWTALSVRTCKSAGSHTSPMRMATGVKIGHRSY